MIRLSDLVSLLSVAISGSRQEAIKSVSSYDGGCRVDEPMVQAVSRTVCAEEVEQLILSINVARMSYVDCLAVVCRRGCQYVVAWSLVELRADGDA